MPLQEPCGKKKKSDMLVSKYTFSGHESFACKTLWLKKGYDFTKNRNSYNAPDAVVRLGVGKNMVASIRYWMRVFGLTQNDEPNSIADYIFDAENGKDPFIEDLGTLWLLHFLLVSSGEATLYNLLFVYFQRERKSFERHHVLNFIWRFMTEAGKENQFNENTVKKDIGTLLSNYILPQKAKVLDDYSTLLTDLDLIRTDTDGKKYIFNIEGKRRVPWQIFLYGVLVLKGRDNTVDYDLLQDIGLMFCMNDMEVIDMCKTIETQHIDDVRYTDIAGIRQLQFINDISSKEVLNEYYD